jgi:hypothetical protein
MAKSGPKPAKTAHADLVVRRATSAADESRARAEALLAKIVRRLARIRQDFYTIGMCLKELRDARLFVALGHRTFEHLLASRRLVGRTQAYKLMAIVEHVSRDKAIELGEEKAYALARFAAAAPDVETVEAVVERGIDVGRSHKRVEAMTVAEIERARRRVAGIRNARARGGASAHKRARQCERFMRERGIDARVRVVRRSKKWWAQFEVLIDELPLLAAAG